MILLYQKGVREVQDFMCTVIPESELAPTQTWPAPVSVMALRSLLTYPEPPPSPDRILMSVVCEDGSQWFWLDNGIEKSFKYS